MKRILTIAGLALLLSAGPALAQTTQDPADDTLVNGDANIESEDENQKDETFFSTIMPSGLLNYFSDEEKEDYQQRLNEAKTPQERNAIRQELQRENQERHLDNVQSAERTPATNRGPKAPNENLGFFESMQRDFNSVVNGEASNPGYSRDGRDTSPSDNAFRNSGNGPGLGRGSGRGGPSSHSNAGGNAGGNGSGNAGGNGGGKNK